MTDIFLYCSYNLAASGYQLSKVDNINEKMILINRDNIKLIPPMVKTIFTHGGAKIVLGQYQNDRAYFVIKGIVNENQEKSRDEQGRKVFVNVAFVWDDRDTSQMTRVSQYILGNFSDFSRELCNMIEVKNDAIGYEVKYEKLNGFLKQFRQGTLHFDDASNSVKYLNMIKNIDISPKNSFSFVVLESSWKYFFDMNGIKLNFENQKNGVTLAEFEGYINKYSGLINITDLKTPDSRSDGPIGRNIIVSVEDEIVVSSDDQLREIAIPDKDELKKTVASDKDELKKTVVLDRDELRKTVVPEKDELKKNVAPAKDVSEELTQAETMEDTHKGINNDHMTVKLEATRNLNKDYLLYIFAGIGGIAVTVSIIKLVMNLFRGGK